MEESTCPLFGKKNRGTEPSNCAANPGTVTRSSRPIVVRIMYRTSDGRQISCIARQREGDKDWGPSAGTETTLQASPAHCVHPVREITRYSPRVQPQTNGQAFHVTQNGRIQRLKELIATVRAMTKVSIDPPERHIAVVATHQSKCFPKH